MKPLSEVVPGLLVIHILIQAVWRGALHLCQSQWSIGGVKGVNGVKGVMGQKNIPYVP